MTDVPATPSPSLLRTYRVALGCSLATAAVALVFFAIGLGDGSISSFNLGLWLMLLVAVGGSVVGGLRLRAAGRVGAALLALSFTAVPALVGALFMLVLLIAPPRWN